MAWTTRYCRADAAGGGDGTTNTNSGANGAWTFAEATTNLAAGMELWIVAAGGTQAYTTSTWTIAAAGTHSSPVAIRGCNATPNDLSLDDSDNSPAMPQITFTTGGVSLTGTFILLQKLNISATARISALVTTNTESNQLLACRIVNTSTNAGARAILLSGSAQFSRVRRCYLEGTTSAGIVFEAANATSEVSECRIVGGTVGVTIQGGTTVRCIHGNIIQGYATTGISLLADARGELRHNTIHGGTNGILIAAQSTGTGYANVAGNLFSGTMTNGVNYAGSPSTLRVRCFGNQYGPGVTNKRVGIFEDQHWYDVNLANDPHVDSATNDFRIDPESDAYGAGYPQYFESLTYKTQGVAGAVQLAADLVAIDQATIDEIVSSTAAASAAAILVDSANRLYTDSSGRVRLTPEVQTGVEIPTVTVTNTVLDVPDPNWPPFMNSNLIMVDGVALAAHALGMVPSDERAQGGIEISGSDATVESGGTTTQCVLSAAGLPVGFDPADPPRAVKFLDGDAVNEVALVETWTPGTHMLTYTAIGTAPSNGSHVRFGPPEPAIGDKTGYKLAADGLDLVVIEIGINARQALSPILAASAGVLSGSGSPSILIKAASNPATTRITASVDGEGNRSAVTLNLPS